MTEYLGMSLLLLWHFDFLSGFRVAGTHFAIGEAFPLPINSHPYPAIVFFEPT